MKWSLLITWSLIFFMSTSALLLSPTQKFNKETLKYEDDGDAVIDDHVLYQVFQWGRHEWVMGILDHWKLGLLHSFCDHHFLHFYILCNTQTTKFGTVWMFIHPSLQNSFSSSIELRSKINEDSKLLVQAFIVTIMLEVRIIYWTLTEVVSYFRSVI